MARFIKYWDRVRSSFWFLPSILVGAAVVLAVAAVTLDREVSHHWSWFRGWIYTGSAEGATAILSTVAGSMITIAGVVFSLTLIALTLASSQFGPRLLRNFMRDTVNQVVIGTFVSTFLYCLIILRSIRREEAGAFVPHLSVTLGLLLALVSLAVLIYFIHHVALSIQADEVIARVATELTQGIDRLFPAKIGSGDPQDADEPSDTNPLHPFDRESYPVGAPEDGYLQLIEPNALMKLAVSEDVLLRVERRPGHYLIAGCPLVRVWPGKQVTDALEAEIAAAFVLGSSRTPTQDVEFSIGQLVEIAVRALSPGVNDPFTAITCVDRLGSALSRLAQREMPSPYRRDERGRLRVVTPRITFPDLVDAAFNQIRQAARSDTAVTIRLLETVALIAGVASRSEDRTSLLRHAEMVARGAREGLPEDEDRRVAEERYQTARKVLVDSGRSDR